jgi:hypothetical protein
MKTLSKKKLVKITTSDIPMNLRKSPPEKLIDQSTTQNISLMLPSTNLSTTLVAFSAKRKFHNQSSESSEEDSEEEKILSKKPKTTTTLELLCTKTTYDLQSASSSEESKTDSQFNAKYEANMRALGRALCNWQFEKCYLTNCPVMRCQFKDGAATLHIKGASFYGQGHTDGMLRTLSQLGASVKNTTWTTTKRYCLLRPTMVLTVFGHGPIQRETMSGLRRT